MIDMFKEFHMGLVLLSYAVAVVSAYAAFDLIERLLETKRMLWLFLGAASLGIGIWSMHFIAMMAHHIGVEYEFWMNLAAFIVVLAAAFISFLIIGFSKYTWGNILASSAIYGTGATVMHYVSASAVLNTTVSFDPVTIGYTVLIGFIDALIVFTLAYRWKHLIKKRFNKILCSIVMGIGMIVLHFIAVSGTTYSEATWQHAVSIHQQWISWTIFIATLFILALAITCIYIDKRLAASELRYKPLFEDNQDAVLLVNDQGNILHGNAAVTKILGYPPSEYKFHNLSEFIEPRYRAQMSEMLSLACEGTGWLKEMRFIHKSGSIVYLRLSAIPRISEQGCQDIYVMGKDITESKNDMARLVEKHEMEIRSQDIKFQTVVDSVLDAVIVTDSQMNIVVWNQGAERMFGHTCYDTKGKGIEFIIPETYLQRHYEGVENRLRGDRLLGKVVELEGKRKGGETFPIELSLNTWTTDQKTYYSAVIRDISERKRTEAALLRSEEMYRNLIEYFPEAIMIGRGNRCLYVNAIGVRLLGGTLSEDILQRNVYDIVHPDFHQNVRRRIQLTEKQGVLAERTEEKWIRLDGKQLQVQVSAIPAVFNNEAARIVVVRDITELQKAREIYERSEKLTVAGELAAGIAHEIRNPLTAIKGFLQLTKGDLNADYYSIMASEMHRIELIIGEMLMVAKPQQTSFLVKKLQSIIRHVVTLMESQAHLNNVSIETDFPEEDVWISCDENQLKQVFINMVKNSIEAMSEGGTIYIQVERDHPTAVQISIRDEGSGISDDKIAQLGQPFYTTKDKGTGLGLMVSYNIIRNHQGHINVHSVMDEGTTFTITLPVAEEETVSNS